MSAGICHPSWEDSLSPGQDLPSTIFQAAKPPLVVCILIQIPCVWTFLDGKVAQEFGALNVLLPHIFGRHVRPDIAERIQPFKILVVVDFVSGIADARIR